MERKKYYCNLIFSSSPLTKSYKYKDEFQIIPLSSEFQLKYDKPTHFPLLIEYHIDLNDKRGIKNELFNNIKDWISEAELQNKILKTYIRLLSTFTNYYFFTYRINQGWFFPINREMPKDEYNEVESVWGINHYLKKGLKKRLDIIEFTELKTKPVNKVIHNEYYQSLFLKEAKKEISISHFTDNMFDSYSKLNKKEKEKFDSAITLIYNGQAIMENMKSLAFISFISSIETMSNFEYKDLVKEIEFECNSCKTIKESPYKCPECGKPIWGISQQFKLYLKDYLSKDPKSNAIINKLYSMRSKIVHSGYMMIDDIYYNFDDNPIKTKEFESLYSIKQYSKMSIVNWLLKNRIKKAIANTSYNQ